MEKILKGFIDLLEYADAHDGIIAMVGIAVTVWIFYREVTNNFYTLEKENFNEVFRPAYKEIPKKIKQLENASQQEWDGCFEELMDTLMEMLDSANYFKYTMPYLYELLGIYIREIGDLSRHDNWRIYRSSKKQVKLITKKSCKIIRAINNASKGRVTGIRIYQSLIIRKIKAFFISVFVDRPYDRIASCVIKTSCYENVTFKNTRGEPYMKDELKQLEWKHFQIHPNAGIKLVKVVPIYLTEGIRFGYLANIRAGKIGLITLKMKLDRRVKIISKKQVVKVDWKDEWAHKVVVIWKKIDDDNHLFYDVVKVKSI